MARMISIKQAAKETGLTESEIRTGIHSRKYPAIRVGTSGKGKFMLDAEELESVLKRLALSNIKSNVNQHEIEVVSKAAKGGEDDKIIPFTTFRMVK
jgi:hypothetical protein